MAVIRRFTAIVSFAAINLVAGFGLVVPAHAGPISIGTIPFVLEDNRVYVELLFSIPDGSPRKAWTFVDIGTPNPLVSPALYKDLQLDKEKQLTFQIGDLSVGVPSEKVVKSDWFYGFRKNTEFVLPGSIMEHYQIAIDYSARTLTFAKPGTLRPEGIPVPCQVNRHTGLISVGITVDGRSYRTAIDNGSAYTWFSDGTAQAWIGEHPDWQRGTGAVGEANMQMMSDWSFLFLKLPSALQSPRMASLRIRHSQPDREAAGIILRVPEIAVGSLLLHQVGALAVEDMFDWYSERTPGPVVGWLGGNILKSFRLTIDFPNQITYWQRQRDLDPHDLDQVGVTLLALGDNYFVAGIASQDGKPTVIGIQAGDHLLQIDALPVTGTSRDAVLSALHGKVGDTRTIVVDRDGKQTTVQAPVTRF